MFIRSRQRFSDDWLLDVIGLGNYQPADALFDFQRHVVIGNSDTWTVIGDDFEWEKFHSPSPSEVLGSLVASVDEVFLCLLPDTDDGFEFTYWRNEAIVRSFQKQSADWGKSYTVREHGTPLRAEADPVAGRDVPTERVWAVARSLGFDLADSVGTYRVFAGPERTRLGFDGPFISNVPRNLFKNPILGPRLRWRRT